MAQLNKKKLSAMKFDSFLNNHKRGSDPDYSHTIIPNHPVHYGGSYNIPASKYEEFLDRYHKEVFEKNVETYLTEKHLDFSPILIDLDFRFNLEIQERQYTEEFILEFLDLYMKELSEILIIKGHVEIFLLEKIKPKVDKEKKIVKDGVHIMIPSILTIPMIQYIVRYRMIKNDGLIQKFKDMNITNSIDDIIDICVIEKNNWQMYGSTKPNCEAYKLTKIYSYFKEKIKPINVDKYDNRHLLSLFSIRNKNKKDLTIVNENKIQDINN